jgi:RNA polymerase sigma-70 factor (ECF subfamily)
MLSALFGTTDEQAMWRVQTQDDAAAFTRLVERWEKPVHRLCARMTGDEHLGQDLAQEAFTRAFLKRKDWTPTRKFSTWLWRIALNLCYDELRRRRRRAEEPAVLEPDNDARTDEFTHHAPTPDEALASLELASLVRAALLALPETHRSVLVLRHYEGLKFREIAEVLELPEGTIKSRMSDALHRLAKELEPILRAPAVPRRDLPAKQPPMPDRVEAASAVPTATAERHPEQELPSPAPPLGSTALPQPL